MKRWEFALLMVVAVVCVCLTLVTIVFARQNQKLQAAIQAQQVLINKGALSQQIGANLVREMAATAKTDERMKQLLLDNGYKFPTTP
jgi:Na+-translocating ferredoxin:NAD+ oxidoreductase RnfG subunit